MKLINFKTDSTEGDENIMSLEGLNPTQIRFNHKSKQISIVCEDNPDIFFNPLSKEELEDMTYAKIKKFVEKNGGKATTKKAGIEYLLNL